MKMVIWLKVCQVFSSHLSDRWRMCYQKALSSIFQKSISIKDIAIRKYSNSDNKSVKNLNAGSCNLNLDDCNSKSDANQHDQNNLNNKLIDWAIQNNISFIAFSELLKVLSNCGIENVPKNSRTLLKAKEAEFKVSTVPPGTYTHFGLENNLKNLILKLIEKNVFNEIDISLSIFVDYLPLSNITQKGLWVILGSVVGFTNVVFCIGAYHGYSKPKDANLFLSEMVKEAKNLCQQGLKINDIIYNVRIKNLICDAPAKAFVLNIKNYAGYSSCTKCKVVGKYTNKSICFEEKCIPRTDEDFEKNFIYRNNKTSLLEIPNFGIVSSVPLDYMHLVCLGVVKKLLTIWLNNKDFWICENSAVDKIKSLADFYPCEFPKKPKSLSQFTRWNANEFRQFLLYYGPMVLKSNLKQEYYDHFLLLHVACRLLCLNVDSESVDCGRELLNTFVKNYKNLYKSEQITHNVHGLYHLADDTCSHGTLDSFSSFSFEKFLIKLRNLINKSKKKSIPHIILKQSHDKVVSRSLQKIKTNYIKVSKKIKKNESDEFNTFSSYERLSLKHADIIPHNIGNNYVCLKNKKLIEVTEILEKKEKTGKNILIAGKEFSLVSNFYSDLFATLELDVYEAQKLSDTVTLWPAQMIDKKCMKIPFGNDGIVLVGLLDENF